MRVCSSCGHKDYPWKNRLHALFTDYCHIGELEVFDGQLAFKISQSPKFFSDGIFNYRLKVDGFIFRIWKEDARHPTSLQEPPQEVRTRLQRDSVKNQKLVGSSPQLPQAVHPALQPLGYGMPKKKEDAEK